MSDVKKIRAVIDRVLWTAGATKQNRALLAEAIAEELAAPLPAEQPSNPVPRRATDAEIAEWAERHDITDRLGGCARAAFEDAESLHQTYAEARIVGQQTKGGGNG